MEQSPVRTETLVDSKNEHKTIIAHDAETKRVTANFASAAATNLRSRVQRPDAKILGEVEFSKEIEVNEPRKAEIWLSFSMLRVSMAPRQRPPVS